MKSKSQLFSERKGFTPPKPTQPEEMNKILRTALWNVFHECFGDSHNILTFPDSYIIDPIYKLVWSKHLQKPVDELKTDDKFFVKRIFLNKQWHAVFDLIEFCLKNTLDDQKGSFSWSCNQVLEEENYDYRIVGELVTEITSEEEIESIETAMNVPFEGVKEHIHKATALLYNRDDSDFRGSIQESIKALESLANEVLETDNGTLGQLVKELNLHPAFKESLSNLYGFTSDAAGFRHGGKGKPLKVNRETAQFILITSSAFVNYIISTHS